MHINNRIELKQNLKYNNNIVGIFLKFVELIYHLSKIVNCYTRVRNVLSAISYQLANWIKVDVFKCMIVWKILNLYAL